MSYDITEIRKRVVAKYPYFGGVAAGVDYEATDRLRTTGSDGKTIYYNPAYMESLPQGEQIFVLAHEICHIAFQHILRSADKDMVLWKKATDAVVNQMLKRDGLEMPPGSVDDPEAIDYDAEQYYEILLEHKLAIELIEGNMVKPEGPGGSGGSDDGDGEGQQGPGGEDDHSLWEDAVQQHNDQQEELEEKLRKELQKIQEMAEDSGEEAPAADQDGEKDDADESALVSKKVSQSGNAEEPGEREVGAIGAAAPIIDWCMILRDTIHYGVDWSFTHAILENNIVRPALEEVPMPETEIVLDTSWSVDDQLLRNFLRECRNILQHSKVKAGCFDTVFYGFHDIRTEEDIETMPFPGGGGTSFDAAVDAFTLRVDNRIIFTDGEAPMPETPLDAVWMVYGDQEIAPPGGKVIHITGEQLAKLKGEA